MTKRPQVETKASSAMYVPGSTEHTMLEAVAVTPNTTRKDRERPAQAVPR